MNSSDILSINAPGSLFQADNPSDLKREYHDLIKIWHPDINHSPDANSVLVKIKALYERAEVLLKQGRHESSDTLKLTSIDGKSYKYNFVRKHTFELGEQFIGSEYVLYVIDKKHKAFYSNAKESIHFKFKTDGKMEKEFSKYLPKINQEFETEDSLVVCYNKTVDLLSLRDALPLILKMNNFDRHVAWILSGLHNLICFFQFSEIAHLDISLDNYFISANYHSGALLGGWWYSTPFRSKIKFLPKKTYSIFPPEFWKSNEAIQKADQYLMRRVGRELLGNDDGVSLLKSNVAPVSMINYLRLPPTAPPIEEYGIWQDVLKESFGKRKFVEMFLDQKTIYGR